eukprot:TRINITY_DN5704_c0_g1_i2.p1 TRINITY_DN5704_c0_g1~~TRINITY_DN5704_c0_g1_i2.p1  ORF type:complete len:330 (+),score=67.15 TRINITY_DN5704_c0_g1_i2:31-990(+)
MESLKGVISQKIVEATDFLKGMKLREGEVGFLGLGPMSSPVVQHLVNAGVKVHLWANFNHKAEEMKHQSGDLIKVAETPQEAIKQPHGIFVMLEDYNSLSEQLLNHDTLKMLNHKVVIVSTPMSATESKELGNILKHAGAEYIEAPLSGLTSAAEQAKLQILVATTERLFDEWKSLLSVMGTPHYVGAIPNASSMRLSISLMIAAQNSAFALSVAMVKKAGLSVDSFVDIVRPHPIYSHFCEQKIRSYIERDYTNNNNTNQSISKDIEAILQHAEQYEVDTNLISALKTYYAKAVVQCGGDVDCASIYDVLDPPATASK